MDIGMVGLGRMGANMARRQARKGVRVAAQDVSPVARSAVEHERGIGFVEAGVSGGVWGLDNGYALMLGGARGGRARASSRSRACSRLRPTAAGRTADRRAQVTTSR